MLAPRGGANKTARRMIRAETKAMSSTVRSRPSPGLPTGKLTQNNQVLYVCYITVMTPTRRIPIRQLLLTGDAILRTLHFEAADRQTILDVLLYAQLRGNSQNFIKLCSGGVPRRQGTHCPELLSDTGVTFALDAKGTFGMVRTNDPSLSA